MIRLTGLVNLKAVGSTVKEELTGKQTKLDVDGDGKLEKSDFEKLRAQKDEVVLEGEGEDHEVSMGQSTLDSIIKHATELKEKLGQDEKDIPAWIQDHIAVAENNLDQANTSYHEYGDEEGYKPQNESVDTEEDEEEELEENLRRSDKKGKVIFKQAFGGNKFGGNKPKKNAFVRSLGSKGMNDANKDQAIDGADILRAGRAALKKDSEKIAKRFKGIDTALGKSDKRVKNPETGKEILATTAAKDPSHPAHSAAKSALGKKK